MNNMHGKFCRNTKINFRLIILENKILQKLLRESCKVLYVALKTHTFLQSALKNFLKTSMLQSICRACKAFDAFSEVW